MFQNAGVLAEGFVRFVEQGVGQVANGKANETNQGVGVAQAQPHVRADFTANQRDRARAEQETAQHGSPGQLVLELGLEAQFDIEHDPRAHGEYARQHDGSQKTLQGQQTLEEGAGDGGNAHLGKTFFIMFE